MASLASPRQRWLALVAGIAFALGLALQVPQSLRRMDPRYRGIVVALNSDEAYYNARVQEALSGRPEQADEAFIGGSDIAGTQAALIESAIGRLFAFTHWRASEVLQLMDSIIPMLLFLTLIWFFRLSGVSRSAALLAALAFVIIEFYNLGRPVHLRDSTLLTMLSIALLLHGVRGARFSGIAGGVLLGLLVGVYVWSWMWAWAFWGIWLLWECVEAARRRAFLSSAPLRRWLSFGAIGALAAAPFVAAMIRVSRHPLYEEAVFRSGMFQSRLPESWPYSILFGVMAAGTLVAALRMNEERRRALRPAMVMALAAFAVIHQQLVHGVVFFFVSHSVLLLVIAAVCCVLAWKTERGIPLALAAAAAAVYLAGVSWDGRHVVRQFRVSDADFSEQHLAALLPVLDAMPRSSILSDADTSHFVSGFTHHDIVWSIYAKNVLLSHAELAERRCLEMLPLPPQERRIPEQEHLVYPDAVRAFRGDPSVRAREIALVEEACARVDAHPEDFLARYGVDLVLWNERGRPSWRLDRLGVPLDKLAEGEGWSLWKITP